MVEFNAIEAFRAFRDRLLEGKRELIVKGKKGKTEIEFRWTIRIGPEGKRTVFRERLILESYEKMIPSDEVGYFAAMLLDIEKESGTRQARRAGFYEPQSVEDRISAIRITGVAANF